MERERFDEIHEIYIRMTEICEALLSHPLFRDVATDPLAGELLGQCNALGHEAAVLKILTLRVQANAPALHQIWLQTLAK